MTLFKSVFLFLKKKFQKEQKKDFFIPKKTFLQKNPILFYVCGILLFDSMPPFSSYNKILSAKPINNPVSTTPGISFA